MVVLLAFSLLQLWRLRRRLAAAERCAHTEGLRAAELKGVERATQWLLAEVIAHAAIVDAERTVVPTAALNQLAGLVGTPGVLEECCRPEDAA